MPVRSIRHAVLCTALCLVVAVAAMAAEKAAEIRGKVFDMERRPLAGVSVVLTSPSDPGIRQETFSDAKGRFSFEVVAGAYRLRFETSDLAPFEGDVEIGAGARNDLEVQMVSEDLADRQAAVDAYNAGAEAYRAGQFDAAGEKFRQALGKNPEMVEPLLPLADVHRRAGAWSEAAEVVERYLALHPEDAQGWRLAFEAYSQLGDAEGEARAIDHLRDGPYAADLAKDVYNLGAASSRRDEWEAAAERFRMAASLDPTLAAAWRGQATALYNLRRFDEALAAVEDLLARIPGDVEGLRLRYVLYDAIGDQAKVAEALAAYGAAAPGGAVEVLYSRAELDFDAGRIEEARDALLRVLELAPDHPRAHYTLGRCHLSLGDETTGVAMLRRFLELAPDDPDAATAREMLTYYP